MKKDNIVTNKRLVNSAEKRDSSNGNEDYLRSLAVARMKAMPGNLSLIVGSEGNKYTKEEVIKNIEEGSKLGKEIIDAQIEFLREMAEGKIYQRE